MCYNWQYYVLLYFVNGILFISIYIEQEQLRCSFTHVCSLSTKRNQAPIPCSLMWFTSKIFSTILQFDLIAYRQVQHRNVVRFIGACTNSPHLCIITGMLLSGTKVAWFLQNCYHSHVMAFWLSLSIKLKLRMLQWLVVNWRVVFSCSMLQFPVLYYFIWLHHLVIVVMCTLCPDRDKYEIERI